MVSTLFGAMVTLASAESAAFKFGDLLGRLFAIALLAGGVIWLGAKFGNKK
jgi:hypothetical protein